MKLSPEDLEKIAQLTLEHYNRHAEEFWEGCQEPSWIENIGFRAE
jgi:hypothetical protein